MDLREYLRILRKRWLSIAIITLLGVALGAGYSLMSPKIYRATTQNFVAIGGMTTSNNTAVTSGASFVLQRVKSYVEIVDSPEVLAPVIAQTGVPYTVNQLAGMVTANNPPQTVLLNVSVTNGDPVLAKELANAIAVSYGRQIEILETPAGISDSPVKVTVTAPASVPSAPISPNTKVNIALGLILGLGIGVAYAILREQFDTSIKGETELAQISGHSNLGMVVYDPDATSNPLIALNQQSGRAEGFRTVRTNLRYVDVDQPPKAVVVTSAIPSEGKSTSACNLAIALAQGGSKVCLVEADLRKPRVADYMGIEGSVGLTNVLTGQITLDEACIPWRRGMLTVIPSGPIPPNPSELLGSQQMAHLLSELRGTYDAIVIDAPPLLPVTDAAVLARNADGALLVVRFGRTSREQVRKSVGILDAVGARMLGTVLNFVPSKGGGYGYGYGYGYGSGYGYGYGEDESNRPRLAAEDATAEAGEPADADKAAPLPPSDARTL